MDLCFSIRIAGSGCRTAEWTNSRPPGSPQSEEQRGIETYWYRVISVWEVGLLDSKGRISLTMDCERWITEALATPGLQLAPLTPAIALHSTRLPGEFHGDPADRMLVATARMEGAQLLTKDQRILDYARMKHIRVLSA
jgi:PIN domain nuclease of toxin-antitoxin system